MRGECAPRIMEGRGFLKNEQVGFCREPGEVAGPVWVLPFLNIPIDDTEVVSVEFLAGVSGDAGQVCRASRRIIDGRARLSGTAHGHQHEAGGNKGAGSMHSLVTMGFPARGR